MLTVSAISPDIYDDYQAYLAGDPLSPLAYAIPTRPFYRGKFYQLQLFRPFVIGVLLTVVFRTSSLSP